MSEHIETLLLRLGADDRAALRALHAAVAPQLFAVCLRVLRDRAAAEDALQEAFVKIWKNAHRYRAGQGLSPMAWLVTIARNAAIDLMRSRMRGGPGADMEEAAQVAATTPTPEAQAVAAGEARRVVLCLDQLPDDRRAAVRGAYLEGKSYATLAQDAGVPVNTMRSWLRRSLAALRECLAA